ncbi:MAG: hypothetical protein H7A33_00620 [Deltaproteobacteria bacterium]|nr:hypothetical protein [Deltaproteobacteria bacterium]
MVNSARGMMLAVGCIHALRCNTNHCPTGVATTNPDLALGLDVEDQSQKGFFVIKKRSRPLPRCWEPLACPTLRN